MLERMWSEGNTHPLLVGMQTCTATVEISVAVSQETGSQPPAANWILGAQSSALMWVSVSVSICC